MSGFIRSENAEAQAEPQLDKNDVLMLTTEQIEPVEAVAEAEVLVLDQEFDQEPAPARRSEDPFVKIVPAQKRAFPYAAVRTPTEPLLPKVVSNATQLVLTPTRFEMESQIEEARKFAALARSSEDRSNAALYQAVSCAYDFALYALEDRDEFVELLSRAGLTVQDRSPMTPIVKLVFGVDYDKTRLAEYAAVLNHAHRLKIERGKLAENLFNTAGGIKAVVKTERNLRRIEVGKAMLERTGPRETLAKILRVLPRRAMSDVLPEGDEFVLVLARRLPDGEVAMIGEVPRNVSLLERAAAELIRNAT